MKTTTVYNMATNTSKVGLWNFPMYLPPGGSVVFPAGVTIYSDGDQFTTGEGQYAYLTQDGYFYSGYGAYEDNYATFSDGLGVGVLIAGAVLCLWLIRLLHRGIAEV